MPPKPAPGDRERIEAALGPAHRAGLVGLIRTLGVPREAWQEVPALAWAFQTAAAIRLAGELREEPDNGVASTRAALERAAHTLELHPDTIRGRIERLPD